MTLFRHIWMANGLQIQKQCTKLPLGHKNPKNDIWRRQRSLTSDDLGWPRKCQNVSVNHGCHLSTPIHVHITSKHTEVRKFQALKRYGTQISLDMTLEIRSQVKGHRRYGLETFREGVKLFNGWVCQVSWRSANPFASYSQKTPRGVASTPCACEVNAWRARKPALDRGINLPNIRDS